jgi:hypothetical protein
MALELRELSTNERGVHRERHVIGGNVPAGESKCSCHLWDE